MRCVDASVGRPKHPKVMAGGLEGDAFVGKAAQVTIEISDPAAENSIICRGCWPNTGHWSVACCHSQSGAQDHRGMLQIRYPIEHGVVMLSPVTRMVLTRALNDLCC